MGYEPFSFGSDRTTGPSDSASGYGEHASFLQPSGNGTDNGDGSGNTSGELDSNGERFDPERHSGPDKRNADGSWRRKRGRRAGSSASSGSRSKAGNKAGVESLTRILAVVHMGIASATKTPELMLDDMEAESLASATAHVLEEFDIKPDPKIEAIIGLVMVAGSIYAPRVYLIRERRKAERNDKGAN